MESMADQGRLQRGRSYAAHGDVVELSMKDGSVSAKVAGNYRPYYHVKIIFNQLSPEDREFIEAWLEDWPMQLARIRSGELPAEFLAALDRAGISLLPKRWQEMRRSCDCPDSGDPCKHEAAVYYLLAQEIDRDPAKLFSLRGLNLPALSGEALGKTDGDDGNDGAVPDPFAARYAKNWEKLKGTASEFPSVPSLPSFAGAMPAFLQKLPPLERVDLPFVLTGFCHELAHRWPAVLAPSPLTDAEARAFSSDEIRIGLSPPNKPLGETRFISERFGPEKPLAFMRRCLALEGEGGGPSLRFFAGLARFCRSLTAAAALYPDVLPTEAGFTAVWKPALFAREVDQYLTALEPFAPKPEPDARGLMPDRAAYVRIIAAAFLTETVRALRFSAKTVSANDSPVFRALFNGEDIDCREPAYR
jgi:hypothetical protein